MTTTSASARDGEPAQDVRDHQQATGRVKVVVIVGTGRSGSTLLANILGSFHGAFSAGEVRFLWSRGVAGDGYCGCGQRLSQCERWGEILGKLPELVERAGDIDRRLTASTRLRHLHRHLLAPGARGADDPVLGEALPALYRTIGHVTGSTVIDSSKLPAYVAIVTRFTELDVRLVHLVRDPRATAWSWMRAEATGAVEGFDEEMDRFSPLKSATLWTLWNATAMWVWGRGERRASARGHDVPYLRVRYEDLMAEPHDTVARVAEFAGLDGPLPFDGPHTVNLDIAHAVAGNPNRLRHGPTPLRPDREWRDGLPVGARRIVSAVTWPVRRMVGYTGRSR